MKFVVKNARGCLSADFDLSGIALITGRNRAGKSSLIQALGAAITGTASPINGIPKKDLALIVRDGAKDGFASIQAAKGSVSLTWPKGEASTVGEPPQASVYAVGIADILDMDAKTRGSVLQDGYLSAKPTKADLDEALKAVEVVLPAANLDTIWEIVESRGWEAAQKDAADASLKLKGQWEGITGSNFGTKKLDSWTPADWTPDMADMDVADLGAKMADTAKALETALGDAAVGEAEIARLTTESGKAKALILQIADAVEKQDAAEARDTAAILRLEQTPRPPADNKGMACPHCGEPVTMKQVSAGVWQIAKADEMTEDELKAMRLAFQAAETEARQAGTARQDAQQAHRQLVGALKQAQEAGVELGKLQKKSGSADIVAAAREAAAAAGALHAKVSTYTRAKALQGRIERGIKISEILGPKGVRQSKLIAALGDFNEKHLKPLCTKASWGPIVIKEDLGVYYENHPIITMSASEKWRCSTVLRIAMALIDRSDLICLDAAETLEPSGRNELFGLLASIKRTVIVGMMIEERDKVPDLEKAGLGVSLWCQKDKPTVRLGLA